MPANLTQQYLKAEAEYRRAATVEEELACLQVMLKEIPKHKGTDHLQADLKTKIANLKKDMVAEKSGKKSGRGLRIPRQGAGTAILLGGPNAGKSQLICSLTRATPEVAPYPFTTHAPAPAMMPFEDVTVQLIDTPPVTKDFMDPHIYNLIRSADLVLLMVDLGSDDGVEQCQEVLDRLSDTKTRLAAESYLDENDVGLSYTRTFVVPNKIDLPEAAGRLELFHELCPLDFPEYPISADRGDRPGDTARGDLSLVGRDPRLQQAAHGQGARPRPAVHGAARQPVDRSGRPGPQGFHQGPEICPRLGRGRSRRHRRQGRLRIARQGRRRVAHVESAGIRA